MSRMQWKEEYSVGDAEIDQQHQQLFALIDRLEDHELDTTAMAITFEKLDDYVRIHFEEEEELMKACDFPDLEAHLRQHEEFRDWLSTARASFKSEHEDNAAIGHNLQMFLREWLLSHILNADQKYKGHIQPR